MTPSVGTVAGRMRRLSQILLALSVVCLLTATAASASGDDVVRDCADDGQLSKKYSSSELRKALGIIPTDVDEYTDCRDIIRRAQLGGAGAGSGSTGSGNAAGGAAGSGGAGSGGAGSGAAAAPAAPTGPGGDQLAGATPGERRQVDALRADRDGAGRVGGELVRAGSRPGGTDVPTPLLVMLILGVLAAGGAGGYAIRSRGLLRRAA
jgi:hypothetical protein